MEDGMETGKIRGKGEFVNEWGYLGSDGEGTETAVIEFIGGTGSFDIAAEEPDEFAGLVGGSVGDTLMGS